MKKIFAAAMAAFVLALSGCEKAADEISDTTVCETVSESETEITEASETAETTTETVTETESNVETVIIAGKEYPIDTTYVSIDITENVADEVTHATDVSGLGKLKNLQGFSIYDRVDGGDFTVSGLSVLKGSETITSVHLQIDLYDKNDIHIFETMPNLKDFSLYGITLYDNFEFNFPAIERLELVGTFDLAKITHLTTLKDLYMEYNDSDDLSPITNLPQLEGLSITECKFGDYSYILELTNLTGLWISSNPMTEEMYNSLTEQLPNCKITIINDFID